MNAVIKRRAKIQRGIDITVGPAVAVSLLAIAAKVIAIPAASQNQSATTNIEARLAALEAHQTETDKRMNDQLTTMYEKLIAIQSSLGRLEGKLEK